MKDPEKRILTIPNAISIIRIFCIPFFAYFFYKENFITAGAILVCSGITDLFDGALARKLNQVTELGKVLDPIADKLTATAIAILLFLVFHNSEQAIYNNFLCWIFLFFIGKDILMLFIGGILLLCKVKPVAAEIYGKISTFSFYIIMITLLIFGPEIGAIPRKYPQLTWMVLPEWVTVAFVITAALLALVAFFSYFPPVYRQMKASKAERLQTESNSDNKTEEDEVTAIPETAEKIFQETEAEQEAYVEESESEKAVEAVSENKEATEENKDLVDTLIDGILSDIQNKEN